MFTEYGFNFSATRKISISRGDINRVSGIFSSVLTIKAAFLLISLFILNVLIFFVPKFRQNAVVYVFTYGMLLGNVLLPVWFFQGMERMRYIATLNIAAKLFFTAGIFIFIKEQADYIYVPLVNSLGFITVGAISLWIAGKKFGVKFTIPKVETIIEELKEGWHIFISTVAISFYTTSNTFILGLFTNNTIVGYYSAAEKLINVVQGMFTPVLQSVYPYISKLVHESRARAFGFLGKIGLLLRTGSLTASLVIFIFARPIVNIILGDQYQHSIIILRILAFIPFIVGTATIYANFFLLGFGYAKQWAKVIITCGICGLVFAVLFIHYLALGHVGAAVSWVATECCVLTLSYSAYRRLSHADRG
jgi:PST family polysaccharide transporter